MQLWYAQIGALLALLGLYTGDNSVHEKNLLHYLTRCVESLHG